MARAHPGLTIAETGDISASHAQDRIVNGDLRRVELLAIPVTLVVLLLAFGSDDVLLHARTMRRKRRGQMLGAAGPGALTRRQ